jgi:two-component system, NarL family, response regulator YdfI
MDGLEAIRHLRVEHPEVAIVILTTYNEDDLMVEGLRAGARGYLLKDTDRATLIATIEAAARGGTLLAPEILQRVLAHDHGPATSRAAPADALALTARELEVLRAAARGEHNKEIARRLDISERTVKAHLTSIYGKLGVDSRAAAIAIAAQAGWL